MTSLTFPHLKETARGRAIPPTILTALFASQAFKRYPIRAAFFRFLYLSGLRKGQALAATLAQFDPKVGAITWRAEQVKRDEPHTVTYDGEALAIIRGFSKRRILDCAALFQEDGRGLTKEMLDRVWEKACGEIKLPLGRRRGGCVIHDLRHTFVSEAMHAGIGEKTIMDFTGHKSGSRRSTATGTRRLRHSVRPRRSLRRGGAPREAGGGSWWRWRGGSPDEGIIGHDDWARRAVPSRTTPRNDRCPRRDSNARPPDEESGARLEAQRGQGSPTCGHRRGHRSACDCARRAVELSARGAS